MTVWIQQGGILLFGAFAIFMVGCRSGKWRRWGYVLGMLSQPFWFWTAAANAQWGIFALCVFYMFSWMRGFWNHWIRSEQ